MSKRKHSWEERAQQGSASSAVGKTHSWEKRGNQQSGADQDVARAWSTDEEEEDTKAGATDHLIELLLQKHFAGELSAKTVCTISYWAHKAGLDALEGLAEKPNSSSGNFKKR
eukprot:3945703-Amphidinium_carterae.1